MRGNWKRGKVEGQALKCGICVPYVGELMGWAMAWMLSKTGEVLDVLEDLVGELQKARKFERLCSDVQTLGKCHDLGQQKRLSDIKLLKETLLYEQAKLQLKSIKRD
ncbi:hypothetical protein Taro_044102, partial [Colocasia esculenta]|nr:hypothetical protein [Colocasia esculenta]